MIAVYCIALGIALIMFVRELFFTIYFWKVKTTFYVSDNRYDTIEEFNAGDKEFLFDCRSCEIPNMGSKFTPHSNRFIYSEVIIQGKPTMYGIRGRQDWTLR